MQERRGKRTTIVQVENSLAFKQGTIPERRGKKMSNIRETWLFVDADGTANELGEELQKAFAATFNSRKETPSFNDVFNLFWGQRQSVCEKLKKKKTVKGKGVLFTKADWSKKAQTYLKNFIKKAMEQQGKQVSGRVQLLLKSSRSGSQQVQREAAAALLSGLDGAFTEEAFTKKSKAADRQTEMFDG